MSRARRMAAATLVLAAAGAAPVQAAGWLLDGTGTVRSAYYGVRGNGNAGLYRYEGLQSYGEIDLQGARRVSAYDSWRGQVSGVLSASDYRSADAGFVPERLVLGREKGDAALPYRVQLGDIFADFSYRTLQRSLKGVRLEVQPRWGRRAGRQSLVLVSGSTQSTWRGIDLDAGHTSGASYLVQDEALGRWALSWALHTRSAGEDLLQQVVGLAGEREHQLAGQRLTVEGELSALRGDTAAGVRNAREWGLFLQARGRSARPLSYRVSYEAYGPDYAPAGANVPAAHRSAEAHVGWRLTGGRQFHGYFQRVTDDWQSTTPVDLTAGGIDLAGNLGSRWLPHLSGTLAAFTQDVSGGSGQTQRAVHTLRSQVRAPLSPSWRGSLGALYQYVDERAPGGSGYSTTQVDVTADWRAGLAGWQGGVAPGLVLRQSGHGTRESTDLRPALRVDLSRAGHRLRYRIDLSRQERASAASMDVVTLSQELSYRFAGLGAELASERRRPDAGGSTHSYRVAVSWTQPLAPPRPPVGAARATVPATGTPSDPMTPVSRLAELPPGMLLEQAAQRLGGAGGSGNVRVFEHCLVEEVAARQRVVLLGHGGRLQRAVLVVDAPDAADPSAVVDLFSRVRDALLDRYGIPANVVARGQPDAGLGEAIGAGTFVRLVEWERPEGVIHLGIPARMDRVARVEVHFAAALPPVTDHRWGVEQVP